jgi:DNA-3-methyladenine glycosylase II
MDPATLHPQFIRTAGKFSKPLAAAMTQVGAPEWPVRHRQPLARYLARVVVGQQLSTRAAATIWQRIEALSKTTNQPIPALALTASPEALRACGLSGGKLLTLQALATAEAAGQLKRARMAQLAIPERTAGLTALRGIGPWTADMISLFYFREPDIWPLGDLAVRKTFERFVAEQSRFDLERAAMLFAPHRSLLALYMWRITDAMPTR